MATFVAVLFLIGLCLILVIGGLRLWSAGVRGGPGYDPRSRGGRAASGVREPRRPPPMSGAAVAVADPDESVVEADR